MSEFEKTLIQILKGTSDKNISFERLCRVLDNLGFDMRIRRSHYIL